mmetsp:Transcript_103049/g.142583  ORF Transcript_103049/g.142583 Transcript_103049/m.142583 type:complete len:464 (+) Transcript_103049:345-1736(+)
MHFMTARANSTAQASAVSKHHKLGSSKSADSGFDIQANAQGLSVMLWGLVVAKAQQGFKATSAKDSNTVKSSLKNITMLFALIVGASVCKFVATSEMFAADAEPKAAKKSLKHSLKSSNMPESFYDENSSHYMGGAHNVALKQLAEGTKVQTTRATKKSVKKNVNDVSAHSKALEHVASGAALAPKKNVKSLSGTKAAINDLMDSSASAKKTLKAEKKVAKGGHNAALASVKAQAKLAGVPKAFREEVAQKNNKVAKKPFNFMRAAKIGAAIFFTGLAFAYQAAMKSYHEALHKQEQLTKLFNNPNARVAAGAQGKAILKKISEKKAAATKKAKATKKVVKAPKTKKVVKKSANEETLEKILKLLEEQQRVKAEKASQQIVEPPAYQPPVLEAAPVVNNQTFSYTLYDQATTFPTVSKPEIYINPQPQPLLIPQQPAPVVVEQPKKNTKSATVDQIIGLLKKA